ncbi:MAG TPA: pyridoxal-phosphate dependent enzyme [Pirellulales bacterium]|nr:pyridoxal-phosphate dependent enzyme [Pirellulales bacterium]
MSLWRWADRIDSVPEKSRLSLGEGNTPVVRSRRLGPDAGLANLWFKVEAANPSGSYKDRFAAVAVSKMVAEGKQACVATSSGNTGAALAAYCARAGIECRIAIVEGAPSGKLLQMQAYGAQLIRVRGFGVDPQLTTRVFEYLQQLASQTNAALEISAYCYSPAGMSGVETIAFELAEQLPSPPDHVFCQAGGGGLTLAVARGFQKCVEKRELACMPKIECVQPRGNATIAAPLREGTAQAVAVNCTTKVSGLQVPSVLDGDEVVRACRASGGTGHLVEDGEVYETQRRLAREEGLFCEPAAAVSVVAALRAARNGELAPEKTVVCLLTGSAFKDSPSLANMAGPECPLLELSELPW